MNVLSPHVRSLSFHHILQFWHPEPKFLFLGREVRRGRDSMAGFAAGPQCPEVWGQACSGAPVLGPMGLGAVD